MMRMWGLSLVISAFFGCASFGLESLDETLGLSGTRSEEEGQKNLAAIRALLTDQPLSSLSAPELHEQGTAHQGQPVVHDEQGAGHPRVYVPHSPMPLPHSRVSAPDVTVRIPWVPTPPSVRSAPDYWRMPAYTFFAPVGSVHPGTIRCVPDSLGGQRCHAN